MKDLNTSADDEKVRLMSCVKCLTPFFASTVFFIMWFVYHSYFTKGPVRLEETLRRATQSSVFGAHSEAKGDPALRNSARQEGARGLWIASSIALLVAIVWSVTVSLVIVQRTMRRLSLGSRHMLVRAAMSIGLVAIVAAFYVYRMHATGTSGRFLLLQLQSASGVDIVTTIKVSNTVAYLAVASIVVSNCFLTCTRSENEQIKGLADQISQFKLSLYSSATLLTVGAFEIYCLFRWSASIYTDDIGAALAQVTNALTLSMSIFYSVLLTCAYLPVAMIQDARLRQALHTEKPTDIETAAWLKKNGIEMSPLHVLGHYVAILAPVLMGIIAKTI